MLRSKENKIETPEARARGPGPRGPGLWWFDFIVHRWYGQFRRYYGPKLMDFDAFISNMDDMDTRNPIPGSE